MRFTKIFFLLLLGVAIFPFTHIQAKCGVNSVSTQRCEGGGWRTVVQCHDGVRRTMGEPSACRAERRYSVSRSLMRSFCENRCNPPILDCSETPSLDNLMRAICEKTVECRPDFFSYACPSEGPCQPPLLVDQCLSALENASASDELGLSESQGEITFSVIREALAAGTVRFDNDIYCDCMHRLRLSACPGVNDPAFGESYVEELIPEECGNDQYPGTLLPDDFNPVTGEVEN